MGKVINMVGGGSGSGGGTVTITDTTDTHGGTIRTITTDPNATIIEALNVTANNTYTAPSGYAYSPVVVNVAGGSSVETGIFQPSEDIYKPTINFVNTHNSMPFFIMIVDATNTAMTTYYAPSYWFYYDIYKVTGGVGAIRAGSSVFYGYEALYWLAASNSAGTNSYEFASHNSSDTGNTDYTYPRYWVTNTGFTPHHRTDSSVMWRAGRTYKWVAAWID